LRVARSGFLDQLGQNVGKRLRDGGAQPADLAATFRPAFRVARFAFFPLRHPVFSLFDHRLRLAKRQGFGGVRGICFVISLHHVFLWEQWEHAASLVAQGFSVFPHVPPL
jgi:hypothetical protein